MNLHKRLFVDCDIVIDDYWNDLELPAGAICLEPSTASIELYSIIDK